MDELYDNLDNYEDLNIVEQLKNENMALKTKLEEYTIALDNLQKDILQEFEQVSSDFKKLEINYSSLLKTAKIEIERKSKIISDLNIEKDMIVLKALQNRNPQNARSLRDITKPFQTGAMTDNNFAKRSITPSAGDNLKGKCDTGRKEEGRFSSVETVTSCNTDIASRLLKLACKNTENAELWSDRTSDTKENMAKKDAEDSNNTNTKALSIRNRRKSMPAVRAQSKYSSDEECEDTYCRNEPYNKSFTTREDNNRPNADKYTDRTRYRPKGLDERNKVSETSSVEDRFPNYDPNRDRDTYHRNRNDKYGIDRYRGRERYDNTQRHRRYLSPERSRRATRNEDYYQRQEYGRQRLLESPPPDKFQHYQQRNRENRPKHEREDPFNFERRERLQRPTKHKMVDEHYDDHVNKRQRTSSCNKYPEDEKRWVAEKGLPLEKTVSDLLEEMPQYTSCQSPDDYLVSDESCPHPVKEIMNTASTPLEDPRTNSKKYVLKNIDNNAALCTVTGRNVDLKMVDLSKWNMESEKVDLPKALARRPSQCSEEIIKELYMDIDNPVSNMSAESGELLTEDDSNERDIIRIGQSLSSIEKHDSNIACDKLHTKDSLVKPDDKIPKTKKSNQVKSHCNNITSNFIDSTKPLKKVEHSPNDLNKNRKPIKSCTDNVVDKKGNKNKDSPGSLRYEPKYKDSVTLAKEIIAGDLELSDETCDNTETVIETTANTDKNVKSVVKKIINPKTILLDHIPSKEHSANKETKPTDTVQDDIKKHRTKKNISKVKDTEKIVKVEQVDKKDKVKKDKKTKFNELFGGDSNSLITPEDLGGSSLITLDDLGVAALQAKQQALAKYISICEDAQDAVDVNVSETAKAQIANLKTSEINQEVAQKQDSKSQSKPKTKPKSITENKKKKPKKGDSEHDAAPNHEKRSEPVQNFTVSVPIIDKPILVSPIEVQPQRVSVAIEREIQPVLDNKPKTSKNLLHKDGLMKALATSTPQKLVQLECPETEAVSASVEPDINASANMHSANSTAGDQSSTADLQGADVPDVRIFVKRRRRVIKKP